MGMRHFVVGASLLVVALVITFGAASFLQGMAQANRTVADEPFVVEKIRPAAATANRKARPEPPMARNVVLVSEHTGT